MEETELETSLVAEAQLAAIKFPHLMEQPIEEEISVLAQALQIIVGLIAVQEEM